MWEKLNQRERILLLLVFILVLGTIIFLVFKTISKKRLELEQNLQKSRIELISLMNLRDTINAIPQISNLPSRNELLTIVTTRLQELKLSPTSIRDKEEKIGKNQSTLILIEISFNGISLEPLFRFIHQIENEQKGIKVKELLIRKPLPDRDIFDIRLTVYVEKYE